MVSALPVIRCRQIDESDVPAVAALLRRGFPNRNRRFWRHALGELTRREPPPGLPKYGYLLETDGTPIGAILMICSAMHTGGGPVPRCNLSSWYVEPEFRAYAPLLVSQALRHKDVTYLNVSAAPHTWPIIEAQGFSRYSEGIFIAVPALNRMPDGERIEVVDAHASAGRRRSVRAGDAAPARRAWLHQRVVRGVGRGFSVRVPAAAAPRAWCPARS